MYQVRTGTVKGLGTVLVDGKGMTLYLFVPDKQLAKSTCYGACAQAWPPLLLPAGVTSPLAGPGAQSSLLGTTHRSDGTTQVTYNKWPLYLWVGDSQPGQATGQGINNLGGLWYVLSPDGHGNHHHALSCRSVRPSPGDRPRAATEIHRPSSERQKLLMALRRSWYPLASQGQEERSALSRGAPHQPPTRKWGCTGK